MTVQEILDELRPMGKESYKKVMRAHGTPEPFFGVSIGDMQPIRKRIKKDYTLSKELYATGIYDAMYLAGLVADEQNMTQEDLQHWLDQATCDGISGSVVPWVAAEGPHGWVMGRKWIESEDEDVAAPGWHTLSGWISLRPDEELDLAAIEDLLHRIRDTIHAQPDRVRYAMNNFVISVGCYVVLLHDEAKKVAQAVGTLHIDLVGDCKVPFAPGYIEKVVARGTVGKKRKMVRC